MSDLEKKEAVEYLNNMAKEEKIQKELKQEKKTTNKRKRKGFIIATLVLLLGGIYAVSGLLFPNKKKGSDKKNNNIETVDDIEIDDISLADLGLEEDIIEEKNSNYGKTTGYIDKNKLVEKDGTIWKDQNAADKSGKVGKTTVDDKDGSLVVKPDGTVHDKNTGYEVKDETGKVVDEGSNSNGVPNGYVWDPELNKYVPENELGLYTYADETYYFKDGSIAIQKGDKVLKTTLENAKKTLSTTSPTNNNTNTQTPSTNNNSNTEVTQDEGKVNQDGTYTIYGMTYMDKATFQAFLMDENSAENFGLYNGVIYPKFVINEMYAQNQKTK